MLVKLKSHWPALLLIPAVLSLFWPALLNPSAILFPTFSPLSDVMVIHWPKAHLVAQSWRAGEGLPYWTPLILSGMPLAANQLAMLDYPLAWLFLFLPPEPAFNWFFIVHFLGGGCGIYLLLRECFKLSPAAALLGGLAFALNGKWLAHTAGGHVSMVAAIGWMPWMVLGVQMWLGGGEESRGAEEQGRRGDKGTGRQEDGEQKINLWYYRGSWFSRLGWVMVVAVALGMQIVTHTLPVIYSVYLMVAMVGWEAMRRQGDKMTRRQGDEQTSQSAVTEEATRLTSHASRLTSHISRFTPHVSRFIRSFAYSLIRLLPGLILAGLLGAAQLLPLLELVQFSNRSLSLKEATEFSLLPGQLLIGLLLPATKAGHEYVIYVGLVALLLASFSLNHKNRWTWFYGLVFVFAVLFALGPNNPLHSLFYYAVPGFRWVRTPARIFFVGALALAVLVGFGADRLAQGQWSPSARKWLTRLTVALAPLALLVGLGLAFGSGNKIDPEIQRSALALAIFIPAGLVLILLRAQRVLSAQITLSCLGLLLFLDLAWFDTSMLRFAPLEQALSPGRATAEYLAQKPGYFRVYSPSYSLQAQTAAAAGLSLADGVEPVHLAAYDQFMARAGGYHDPTFSVTIPKFDKGPPETSLKNVKPDLKLLGLLNVTYLASAFPMAWPGLTLETQIDQTFVYRNDLALPRVWVAHQAIPAEADWLTQLETLPDVGNVVVVENAPNNSQLSTVNNQRSMAEISSYTADWIEIKTEIAAPGWLVLSEIWYPGWQATVNGRPKPVEKVDGLLRGVYLAQPGAYQIRLVYQPNSVIWGNWISGVTAVFLILGGILVCWRNFATTTRSQR